MTHTAEKHSCTYRGKENTCDGLPFTFLYEFRVPGSNRSFRLLTKTVDCYKNYNANNCELFHIVNIQSQEMIPTVSGCRQLEFD